MGMRKRERNWVARARPAASPSCMARCIFLSLRPNVLRILMPPHAFNTPQTPVGRRVAESRVSTSVPACTCLCSCYIAFDMGRRTDRYLPPLPNTGL